jgi:methylenetetrahydrofolate reductase (NADPH)
MDIVDLDGVQMLWVLRRMRDEGRYMDGREMKAAPRFFLGAAASPFASEPKFQALRENKKVNAGAQFFQTNLIYDVAHLEVWLNELAKRGILDKVYILAGITPLKTLKMARYMREEVPGVQIPDEVLHRMEAADAAGNAQEEGVRIALELIEKIREFEGQGINGLHIMAVGWEEIVPRIVTEGGLLPPAFVAPHDVAAKSDAPAWEPGK